MTRNNLHAVLYLPIILGSSTVWTFDGKAPRLPITRQLGEGRRLGVRSVGGPEQPFKAAEAKNTGRLAFSPVALAANHGAATESATTADGDVSPAASGNTSLLGSQKLDQYGGAMAMPCSNSTGHFILTKINNRWWFCTPAGHVFNSNSVGGITPPGNITDCAGNKAKAIAKSKYGDVSYNWGWQTLRRMASWGFNSVGQLSNNAYVGPTATCPDCAWPGHTQPVPMPYIRESKPATYAMVNQFGYLVEPVKDAMNGLNGNYQAWRGSMLPDVFDSKLKTWWTTQLQSSQTLPLQQNDPWILGLFTDDADFFWGSGASPDYASGHTTANMGWMVLITSPVQTYHRNTIFNNTRWLYHNTQLYVKTQALNPATCSISSPCSLRDYLWKKYGTISALNKAWGSNYTAFDSTGVQITNEAVGMGDGSTKVFSYTLAYHPVSPDSILISVGGTPQIGDCPWFISGCNESGPDLGTNQGTLGSPADSYISATASTINYSTGAVTITFVSPPAMGAAITANYVYKGWMSGGTGLTDEDGSNTRWVGTNPYCLEGPDTNYPTYFSCTGAVGLYNPTPNANPTLAGDLDAWVSQAAAQYFSTMAAPFKAVSQLPYLGLDILGSWGAPPFSRFLQGAAPYLDGAFVSLHYWMLPDPPAGFASAYQYMTQYLGDLPLLDFTVPTAQADSSMSCNETKAGVGDLGTQANRGLQYYNMVNYLLNTPGFNGTYPFVGFDWWTWQDFQQLNQGLVSIRDNAYDGIEDVIPLGTSLFGFPDGGEAANYGDAIGPVKRANAIWLNLTGSAVFPEITAIVNGASFLNGGGISAGSIATIFGTNLSTVRGVLNAEALPLRPQPANTSVIVNGIPAPLFAVANVNGSEQINLQVPFEIAGQTSVPIVINNNGAISQPVQVPVKPVQPGIFTIDGTNAVALHVADYSMITPSSPAAKGETILIYATGLGPVSSSPGTGNPASTKLLSLTQFAPTVTFGGVNAHVAFSGLAPKFVGVYQINAVVPSAGSGSLGLVITVNGIASNPVKIAVK